MAELFGIPAGPPTVDLDAVIEQLHNIKPNPNPRPTVVLSPAQLELVETMHLAGDHSFCVELGSRDPGCYG